jgi:hypothetical protein
VTEGEVAGSGSGRAPPREPTLLDTLLVVVLIGLIALTIWLRHLRHGRAAAGPPAPGGVLRRADGAEERLLYVTTAAICAISGALGVSTASYFPYCFFNLAGPVLEVVYGSLGFKTPQLQTGADVQPPGLPPLEPSSVP